MQRPEARELDSRPPGREALGEARRVDDPAVFPRASRRRSARGRGRLRRCRRREAGRGRSLPLLRAHLDDRLLPEPLPAPLADRPQGLPAPPAQREADRQPRPDRRLRAATRSTRAATGCGAPTARVLPPAPRTRVCEDWTAEVKGLNDLRIQGSWFRCCGGQIRKLIDCCSFSRKRINGDASLTGLLLGRAPRLLRHVLRHGAAVLIEAGVALAALVAGISGAWSP